MTAICRKKMPARATVLVTALAMLVFVSVAVAPPANAANSGCEVVAQIAKNPVEHKVSWSGVATGCYYSVNKRVCAALFDRFGTQHSTTKCSSWSSTSTSRETAITFTICVIGRDYQTRAWTETNTGRDGNSDTTAWVTCQ